MEQGCIIINNTKRIMRTPVLFLLKIIESVFVILRDILFFVIFILVYLVWYFRFPSSEKIKLLFIASDYDVWNVNLKLVKGETPILVSIYPCDLFRIWNYKKNVMTLENYKKQYMNIVIFEARKSK